jgi:hypothetical protein
MKLEQLSPRVQEKLKYLRHASGSIQSDIEDALTVSDAEAEFIVTAIQNLEELREECDGWIKELAKRDDLDDT